VAIKQKQVICMPELPEVETVRRSLLPLCGLAITGVSVTLPKLLQNISVEDFAESVKNKTIEDIGRRGKYLLFHLSGGYTMVVHLRMTGQLRYSDKEELLPAHTHIVLSLSDSKELRYTDIRQFGFWFFGPHAEAMAASRLNNLGPEPLEDDFSLALLQDMLKGRKGNVKAFLLNQQQIAGVGNIYADEALFGAAIHPSRTVDTLTEAEIASLWRSLRDVLAKGVSMRGTTFSDYVDGLGLSGSFQHELKVYARKGKPCSVCSAPIERTIVAGRGTHSCSICQK
jgi:formamidopyrimidine-DNA glycosylase